MLFPPQEATLRKLVALATAAQKADFFYTCNAAGDYVDFEAGDGSSHTFDRGQLGELIPAEYVMPTTRSQAFVTDVAFNAVAADFESVSIADQGSKSMPMKIPPAQQAVLHALVAASEESEVRTFWIIKTDDACVAKFGLDGGASAKKPSVNLNRGPYNELEHSGFIDTISRDKRRLTDQALGSV